jgi:hypothetical protein
MRPYLQNNQSKKGWSHGSSGRAPSKYEAPVHKEKKDCIEQTSQTEMDKNSN